MKNIVRFVLLLALCALPAAAQNNWDWSMAGSTGVVDHTTASLGLYTFAESYFSVRADSVATVEARYPVTNTMGSATDISPAWTTLQMAVTDQWSSGASVTATLYQVEKCSGTQTQLCSITSSDTDQDVHCDSCTFSGGLDFANNAYYVHAVVTKTAADVDPRLWELAIY